MRKLADARAAILSSPLGITADRLLSFAEQGKVQSRGGGRNDHFSCTYKAHLIVTDYGGDPRDLLFVTAQWLHSANPSATEDAITFHVDVIDHERCDISLRIELVETVRATPVTGGIRLDHEPDPDAQAIDMTSLFPDTPDE